jgi:hypothetical protein
LYAGKKVNNVGPKIDYVSRWGSLHRHYRLDGSRVVAYTDLQMPRTVVPLEKIVEFNRFLELIGQENQVSFSMTAAEVGSN